MTSRTLRSPDIDATIAICTCNRLRTLPLTLQAVRRLRGNLSFEVIVVNGPSTDGTTEYLAELDWLRVFDNPELNLSASRNIAIDNAAGRYIAFIDDDAVPEPDWLDLLVGAMQADPGLSAAGGFIRDANGINFQARYVFCDDLANEFHCDNPDYITFLDHERTLFPSLTGTNMLFRVEDLRRIGGFDEVLAYFLDETDVNKRMRDAGLRQKMIPHAEIHHKYAPSHLRTEQKVATNMYPIARSIAYFCIRHGWERAGWEGVSARLSEFYRKEYMWKTEMVVAGSITADQSNTLLHQTARGLVDGIEAGFATARPAERHPAPTPLDAPAVLRTHSADDALRLCLFSQDHARNNQGGIGRWSNLIARGLAARGHEVTMIGELPNGQGQEFCDFTADGFWSHMVGGFGREAGNEADCLGLPAELANRSKRKHTEFLRVMPRRAFQVASTPIWDVEGAATLASGLVPTVLSLHTCAGLMLESKPEWRDNEEYFKKHVLKVINGEIQALRRTPMILANSSAILRDISELYGLDLVERPHAIVPHGLDDIAEPEGLLEARIARREAASTEHVPLRILFLGRLETRKGVKPMVEALGPLLAADEPIAIDIVGAKTDPENFALVSSLAAKYPDRVTVHGFLADAALDGLMRSADIFLAPSLYESFGLIYAEAMRYSVPSVGFAVGGVPEVVTDGEDGLLAPAGDTRALHAALERLIVDAELRNRLSRGARRSFETKFGADLMVSRVEALYRGVAEKGRHAA